MPKNRSIRSSILPSLTQSAVLHLGRKQYTERRTDGSLEERIERFLGIYQTSSPSYVLMAGIASCLRYIQKTGEKKFEEFAENLKNCRKQLSGLKVLRLIGEELKEEKSVFDFDRSKIIISTAWAPVNGPQLHRILREKYHLEMEMEAEEYVLALTSVMDTKEGFTRLVQALVETDGELAAEQDEENKEENRRKGHSGCHFTDSTDISGAEQALTIADGMEREAEEILLKESEGRISGEYAYLYPPGIPLLVPGERISREFLQRAERWRKQGIFLQGLKDYGQEKIQVLKRQSVENAEERKAAET